MDLSAVVDASPPNHVIGLKIRGSLEKFAAFVLGIKAINADDHPRIISMGDRESQIGTTV
jgi:hypothetical protein